MYRTDLRAVRNKGARCFTTRILTIMLVVGAVSAGPLLDCQTYAATATIGEVTIMSGRVRKEASTGSQVAFCVSKGEQVNIFEEVTAEDGTKWYRVSNGPCRGYIRADLVKKTDKTAEVADVAAEKKAEEEAKKAEEVKKAEEAEKTEEKSSKKATSDTINGKGTVKGNYVRVRKKASVDSEIVGYVNTGDILTLKKEKDATDRVWYKVSGKVNGTKISGYVAGEYVEVTKGITTKAEQQKAEEEAKKAEEEAKKAEEEAKKAEEAKKTAEDSKKKTKTVSGEGYVTGDYVRIREKASIDSEIIGYVNSGETLKLTKEKDSTDRVWYKISKTVGDTKIKGYVAGEYVVVTKEIKKADNSKKKTEEVKEEYSNEQMYADETASGNIIQASIKGNGIRIRLAPITGDVIAQLSSGHPLEVLSENIESDGYTWYRVKFSYLGKDLEGYVRGDLVNVTRKEEEQVDIADEDFETAIASFPDSYKNSLRIVHEKHPSWVIKPVDTGLEWGNALRAESNVGKNLVSKNSIASWKSTATQAYSYADNKWYTFDGGSWVSASESLIAYYMDPRNFLDESGLFQFETLNYDENQVRESVDKVLAGTFMAGNYTDTDGQEKSYAETFMNIGRELGISPYLLAARAVQEQGVKGKSNSVSGTTPGYEGYYNYYNIGAFAYAGRSATINGLIYAQTEDAEYSRPWNSIYASLYGGAKYIADKYVSKGQNTLYFQKFNVVNSENGIYSHQYMNNLQAASSESARLQVASKDEEKIVFYVPFYSGMPDVACSKPVSDSNPNTYLSGLYVDGYELSPAFSGNVDSYYLVVDSSTETINISATPVASTSSVGGVGTVNVVNGANIFYVACKAQNGECKTYTITVSR